MNERQQAAQLAQEFLDGKLNFQQLTMRYPESEEDFDIIELFQHLERKENGLQSENVEIAEKLLWEQILKLIKKLSA